MTMEIENYQCPTHGYNWLPDDPSLFEIKNPFPESEKQVLCKNCTLAMKKFHEDYPIHKGNKIWYNVTPDSTLRKLLLGRYTYLRYKGKEQELETIQEK